MHLFGRTSGSAPVALGSLHSPRPLPSSWFGSAIALDSSRIVVGEPRARASGVRAGAVWSWTRGGAPLEASRFEPPHAADGLGFGMTLALGGDWLVVGAPGHDRLEASATVEDCGLAVAYPLADGASPRMLKPAQIPDAEYVIERAPDVAGSPGTWAELTRVRALQYTDPVTDSTERWYRVRAVNFLGLFSAYTDAVKQGTVSNTATLDGVLTNQFSADYLGDIVAGQLPKTLK